MDDLIESIIAWQRQTFPDSTMRGALRHLAEEVIETCFANFSEHVMQYETSAIINLMKEKVKEEFAQEGKERTLEDEIADLFFLSIQCADHAGLNVRDLLQKKLDKNKARDWQVDGDIYRHIPG